MREKYVKRYFALSRLLVSDFLLFKVLFWSSIKKFKVPGSQILEPWVLSLGCWVPGPRSWVHGSGFWVPGLGSWFLRPGSWVSSPGFWVLILDYVILNTKWKDWKFGKSLCMKNFKYTLGYLLKNAKKTCKPNNRDFNRNWINILHINIFFGETN